MPTVDDNLNLWSRSYDWPDGGDEWSVPWGGPEAQWFGTIFPRIHGFMPAGTILEIAPGFGRWTQFLQNHCEHLVLVDLSPKCIEQCQKRFSSCSHLEYYVNDGKSLSMVADNSVDFVFSYDSLVHAEADVIEGYIAQLVHKLTPNGVGFIHHSNNGEYHLRSKIKNGLLPQRVQNALAKRGLLEDEHWRARSLTATLFETYCAAVGLQCIGQEVINWRGSLPIDCFSIFTKKSSYWARPNSVVTNRDFMKEVAYIRKLAPLYSSSSSRNHNGS